MEPNHTVTKKINSLRENRLYRPVLLVLSALCLILVVWRGSVLAFDQDTLQVDDYVEYWAAGKLNLKGDNPYDPAQLLPLQLSTGRYEGVPVMMWNPPWMLALVMPFSIFTFPISRAVWLLFNLAIVFIYASDVWSLYGGDPDRRWISWVIGFTFVPVLDALKTGQSGLLIFLGVAGFLHFVMKRKGFLAGLFLSLLAIKPHLLYLFAFAVLIWSINRKQWSVLLGGLTALVSASIITWAVNPNVIQQYLFAVRNYPPEDWATPTLGGLSRLLLGKELFWVQFLPPALGILWFVYFWKKSRECWDWLKLSPLLILASIFTAAYGWTSDQSVSLIAVLQIAVLLIALHRWNRASVLVLGMYALIDIALLLSRVNQVWLWWFAPAMLVFYIFSMRILSMQERSLVANY